MRKQLSDVVDDGLKSIFDAYHVDLFPSVQVPRRKMNLEKVVKEGDIISDDEGDNDDVDNDYDADDKLFCKILIRIFSFIFL